MATFLARLDALESGADPDRAGTKQSVKKAVAFLATRALDKTERKRLKGLVDVALGPTSVLPPAAELPEAARPREALSRLRGWFDEWTTARAVVKKRGYLIRLGLANHKAPQRRAPSAPPPPSRSTTSTPPSLSNLPHTTRLPAGALDLPTHP
ncbi:hypothetical protein AB3662_37825 [Sorangium cellulosum]|uniref:hypothetical protein n=1 Tax=Sorangium cellulosum TaxID=56 RepID=UPI003D9A24B7